MSFRSEALISAACAAIFLQIAPADAQSQRNLILFVPDGLRALSVTPETAPAMAAVRDTGVNFANPHSLFPTFTMPSPRACIRLMLKQRGIDRGKAR